MNAAKQLALAAEALYAAGFRGRANKLRRVADELALTEAAFDGVHAQLAAVAAERDALAAAVERVRALHVEEHVYVGPSDPIGGFICRACGESVESEPCPTIAALDGEADR